MKQYTFYRDGSLFHIVEIDPNGLDSHTVAYTDDSNNARRIVFALNGCEGKEEEK